MLEDPIPTEDPIYDWRAVAFEMRRRYHKGYAFCVDAGDRLANRAEDTETQLTEAHAQIRKYESLWFMRVYLQITNWWRK